MTSKQGAGVSFSLLLLALVIAWQITKPEEDSHRGRAKQIVGAAPASDTRSIGPRHSRPASRVTRKTDSRSRGPLCITGRVVTHEDRAPATGASVNIMMFRTGASTVATMVTADRAGRFSISPGELALEGIIVEVRTATGFGATELEVEGPFTGTVDTGDLELGAVERTWFRVLTTEGDPISDACAHPVPGGSLVARTDADGNGSIESNVTMRSIRFAAPGFEMVEASLRPGEDSVTVRLPRGSMLTIRVMTAAGEPCPETTSLRVQYRGSPWIVQPTDPLWAALGNTPPKRGPKGAMTFNATTIRLCPVRGGSHLTITVHEEFSGQLAKQELTLGPAESRVVDLVLPGEFGRLSGRVVTGPDEPVEGASATIVLGGGTEIVRTTGETGAFDFGALAPKVFGLRVSSPKHAAWYAAEHGVERDPVSNVVRLPASIVVRLEAGVSLTVKVVDADGKAVNGASIYALDRFGVTDPEGQVVLPHLPAGPLSVNVFFGGVSESFQHDTLTPTATFKLPREMR